MLTGNRALRLLASALVLLLSTMISATAQDWKTKYPTLVYAAVTNENVAGMVDRMNPFVEYLSQRLGVKVTLRVVNDFAAVIEGQRAGNIHIAYHGPSSYARAVMTGVKIEPFVIDVYQGGTKGYYGVFYVRKDSTYQSIQDLKGKTLGLVDPNSTSGNVVPRFVLYKMNVDPEIFFSKVVYTGSHENAIIALQQGVVDVAANWWNNESESNLTRMAQKNMAKYDDFRIIFKSDLIAGSPHAYLADLPPNLKAAIAQAFLDAAKDAPEAFKKASNAGLPWEPVTHETFLPTIELNKFVDELRKKKQ